MGMVSEGLVDPAMRTKIDGVPLATVGSCAKVCHGNEAGTLKEVVSLNTAGPSFPLMGAPTVLIELGMAAITGSPCQMNKAITVGAPANATDADGTGGAGSGSASGDGSAGDPTKPSDPSSSSGSGGGGTTDGAKVTPAKAKKGVYCPQKGTKGPPDKVDAMNAADLRNVGDASKADAKGQALMDAAVNQKAGGPAKRGQAFWSGGGKGAAREAGYTIQEDGGGAASLETLGSDWGKENGAGSNVTGERLWKTISMRSAENAKGRADCFVVGSAKPDNVFASVELPTLLHNPKLNKIVFRDPSVKPPPGPPVAKWKKGPDGCWTGFAVPGR